jgi:hypothetical protein
VVVARWLSVAGVIGAVACNTYDPSLAGQDHDAHTAGTAGEGGSGGVPPGDDAHGGAAGVGGDNASGGGGTSTPPDANAGGGGSQEPPDGHTGSDGPPLVDAPKDTPVTLADAGPDVGVVVDVRAEPPPVRDATVTDTLVVGESMIDDMEDPDEAILSTDGRHGAWFVLNDGSDGGVQAPAMGAPFDMTAIPGGRGASMYAVHTSGHGFTTWSPLIGFWLNKLPSAFKQLYDASRYNAITFYARTSPSDASNFSAQVRVQFPDRDTDPDGQVCTADGSKGCSDHFGKTILLTSEWVKYTVRFSSLQQAGFGAQAASFDAAHLYGIQFQFALGSTFDCWIDDIAFAAL